MEPIRLNRAEIQISHRKPDKDWQLILRNSIPLRGIKGIFADLLVIFPQFLGSNMQTWQKQIINVATAVMVLSGIWMALTVGLGEAVQVVVDPNDPANPLDVNTTAALGGSVDFIDRVAVLGVFVTILGTAGLGIIRTGSGNPPFVNQLIRVYPLILGFIAFSAFGTEAWELLSGDRDWAASGDGYNSYILFLASSMVAAIVSLFRN